MKDLRKRLRSTEDDLKRSQTDSAKLMSAVKAVHATVAPHVAIVKKEDNVNGQNIKKEETEEAAAKADGE